jgi:hypothetical protein
MGQAKTGILEQQEVKEGSYFPNTRASELTFST